IYLEAMVLSVISTTIGLIISVGLIVVINALHIPVTSEGLQLVLLMNHVALLISWKNLFFVLGLIIFFTTIAAIYPAYIASQLRPIVAINQVN
ncbi:MAG: hypothetical protein HQK51_05960, partial [Oligoflexia bacterium]|nr:hypothetical protein [Oligoflexia bacterium]